MLGLIVISMIYAIINQPEWTSSMAKKRENYQVVKGWFQHCNFPPIAKREIFRTGKLYNPFYWFPRGCQDSSFNTVHLLKRVKGRQIKSGREIELHAGELDYSRSVPCVSGICEKWWHAVDATTSATAIWQRPKSNNPAAITNVSVAAPLACCLKDNCVICTRLQTVVLWQIQGEQRKKD